jgi:preprotein translocase subunit SecG
MQEVLLVLQIVIAVAMIGVILLQRSSNDGMGLSGGSGGMGSFMSGRASANLLTKTTAILATLFIVNSLVLAIMSSKGPEQSTILERVEKKAAETPVKPAAPAAPAQKSKPSLPIAR